MTQTPPPWFHASYVSCVFNVEIIHGFTSNFVDICSATLHPFRFPTRSKQLPLDILKFLVTTLRDNDKKVEFVLVDEDRPILRSSEFIRTYHKMNIIVQTKRVYASSINGKIESPYKTLANITISLLLNSSHKK